MCFIHVDHVGHLNLIQIFWAGGVGDRERERDKERERGASERLREREREREREISQLKYKNFSIHVPFLNKNKLCTTRTLHISNACLKMEHLKRFRHYV